MEERVGLLQGFLEELNKYCDASAQTRLWYESAYSELVQEQERKRALNEENYRKQQASFNKQQEKNAADRDALQERIREKILQKKGLLQRSLQNNEKLRDQILRMRDEIARPEYFQYAYRYREYGDFNPEITKLEDFRKVNLQQKVDQINYASAGIWLNKLKALFKSEDMMIEYASFANLIEKARYLCEVENDALKEKAHIEICQMEKELGEAEEDFLAKGAEYLKKQQQIHKDNAGMAENFEKACQMEVNKLREEYRGRQLACYEELKQKLSASYSPQKVQELYQELEKAQSRDEKYICRDGIPLSVKLGQLWFTGADLLKNDKIKLILETVYPFMLKDGRLSIPGIV